MTRREVTDDWLMLLRASPLSIQDMIVLSNCGRETVYRAMWRHVKRGFVESCRTGWQLTKQGRERVNDLLGKAGQE